MDAPNIQLAGYNPVGFYVRYRVFSYDQGFGAGAVTLARLRLHLKYLFNNSRKLHGTKRHLMSFLKYSKHKI